MTTHLNWMRVQATGFWVLLIGVILLFAVAPISNYLTPPVAPVESAPPVDPPLWIVGQTYMVVWDCAPTWLTYMAAQSPQHPPEMSPCFDERVTVETIRADGWLEVRDTTGDRWTMNPWRMIGIQSASAPPRPAR